MSTHKAAHQRALILLDAAKALPGVSFSENDSDMDIMRHVVLQVLGRKFVDGRTDDYIAGCFQVIAEDNLQCRSTHSATSVMRH